MCANITYCVYLQYIRETKLHMKNFTKKRITICFVLYFTNCIYHHFLLMIYCINIHAEPYFIPRKSILPLIICIKNAHNGNHILQQKIINKSFQNYKANYYI